MRHHFFRLHFFKFTDAIVRMEIVSKTISRQIITQCAGTQGIIKKLASCDPCGRKSGLKRVAFLLRLSILTVTITGMCSYEEDYCWPGTCQDQLAKNCDCAQGFVVSRSDSHAKCQRTYILFIYISWCSFKTVFYMSPINRGIHLHHSIDVTKTWIAAVYVNR